MIGNLGTIIRIRRLVWDTSHHLFRIYRRALTTRSIQSTMGSFVGLTFIIQRSWFFPARILPYGSLGIRGREAVYSQPFPLQVIIVSGESSGIRQKLPLRDRQDQDSFLSRRPWPGRSCRSLNARCNAIVPVPEFRKERIILIFNSHDQKIQVSYRAYPFVWGLSPRTNHYAHSSRSICP